MILEMKTADESKARVPMQELKWVKLKQLRKVAGSSDGMFSKNYAMLHSAQESAVDGSIEMTLTEDHARLPLTQNYGHLIQLKQMRTVQWICWIENADKLDA